MKGHAFIFSPGIWQGKGRITFSMAQDELDFEMDWKIEPISEGKIFFQQIVTIKQIENTMRNSFCIKEVTQENFHIEMENSIVGRVEGFGVVDKNVIAWEFSEKGKNFEGFELYELQKDGSYKLRAEFSSGEELRTFIQGEIWRIE